jgi:hypothetical protein
MLRECEHAELEGQRLRVQSMLGCGRRRRSGTLRAIQAARFYTDAAALVSSDAQSKNITKQCSIRGVQGDRGKKSLQAVAGPIRAGATLPGRT